MCQFRNNSHFRPDTKFDFPDLVWKDACKAWCPATKPPPPPETKLVYVEGSDPETGRLWAADRGAIQ